MSYEDKDQSRDDGEPINLYYFQADTFTFRYTDYARKITVGGFEYLPRQIDRTEITYTASLTDDSKLDIKLPENDNLCLLTNGTITPETFKITVYEVHVNDPDLQPRQIHMGLVTSISTEARQTVFSVVSIMQTHMDGEISNVSYSRTCNHKFGSAHCGVNLEGVAHTGITVAGFGVWEITLSGAVPTENAYVGGTVKNMRTGATQDVAALDGVNLLTLGGFIDIAIGDALTFYKACDHTFDGGCAANNNQINYGGFINIPRKNPFVQGFGEETYINSYGEPS